MDRRCAHCDQLLLPDDTVCWQCGRALSDTSGSATARDVWRETGRELQLSPRLVYGGLTLLLTIAALLLIAFLGRQPRLQAARTDLPAGYAWFRNSRNDFTLFLPQTWELLDAGTGDRQSAMDLLVETEVELRTSYHPLGLLDEELHTLFYAAGPMPGESSVEGRLLVARSQALNQLSPAELMAVAEAGAVELGVTLQEAQEVEDYDQSRVILDVVMDTDDGPRRCQQHLYPGAQELLLVSACAPPEPLYQQTLSEILGSLQRLSP